ncbi:MAG: Fic family protein, partial [Candidatus Electrothrix sp. AR3]|nr:Fic family protein [Candidatus Electrothrix sp. AR3]
ISTAEHGKQTFQSILSLRQEVDKAVVTLGRRAENGRRLAMHLYKKPSVSVGSVMDLLELNRNPAQDLIAAFQDLELLTESTGYKRNRIFTFKRYLDIFKD